MNIGPATAYPSRWEDKGGGCVRVQQYGAPEPGLLHPTASSRGYCPATEGHHSSRRPPGKLTMLVPFHGKAQWLFTQE